MQSIAELDLPRVGIGCNAFGTRIDANQVRAVVDAAIENEVAFFDTADVYGLGASEELLGQAIRGRRDEVIVATGVSTSSSNRADPQITG